MSFWPLLWRVKINRDTSIWLLTLVVKGVQVADFFVVKRQHLDIPALYEPHGRYRFSRWGINWRALIALLVSIGPALPGLAYNVNSDVHIGGAIYINNFSWYYGFFVAFSVYSGLSLLWPDQESLVPCMIESIEEGLETQLNELGEKIPVTTTETKAGKV